MQILLSDRYTRLPHDPALPPPYTLADLGVCFGGEGSRVRLKNNIVRVFNTKKKTALLAWTKSVIKYKKIYER